ncbi:MAG: manganese efflux pump MntP family protein [Christensenellales bacterium]|jgi:putative Mn2+ efflux pump MntP
MTLPALIITGFGLSMDAAAVTTCNMLAYGKGCGRRKWLMPLFFGAFQGIMPLLGSFLGYWLEGFISRYSNALVFVIFAIIGGKMIWDGIKNAGLDCSPQSMRLGAIFLQAIATSIDAFAVGVGLAASGMNVLFASPIIALITFAICSACLFLGDHVAKRLNNRASLVGGLMLAAIAVVSLF